jgi:hypothetical protein
MSDQGEPIGQEREQKQCACLVFRLISNCRRNTFEAYHLPVLCVGFPPPLDLGQRSGARKEAVRAPNGRPGTIVMGCKHRRSIQAAYVPVCPPVVVELTWPVKTTGTVTDCAVGLAEVLRRRELTRGDRERTR